MSTRTLSVEHLLFRAAQTGNVDKVKSLCLAAAAPGGGGGKKSNNNNKAKIDLNATTGLCNRTALQQASWYGSVQVVQLLLELGADVNVQDSHDKMTPLHESASRNHFDIVRLLLQYGANPNHQGNHERKTPLHLAVEQQNQRIVRVLLKHGRADPNRMARKLKNEWTALDDACRCGAVTIARLLLKYGADPNIQPRFTGQTALHQAALKGHEVVVQLLLDRGARLTVRNQQGKTPMDVACENEQLGAIFVLFQNGIGEGLIQMKPKEQESEQQRKSKKRPVSALLEVTGCTIHYMD